MNKMFVLILFIFVSFCYSENSILEANAEYCLAYDTINSNCGMFPSRYQLKISQLIKNVDFPNLNKKNALCSWHLTNIYAHINNEKIELDYEISMSTAHDIKTQLKYNFTKINPWKCYGIIFGQYLDLFNSLSNKIITIEWEKPGICEENTINGKFLRDTISGKFNIVIKGKCNEEDLLWNAKYDIRKIPSPIDTLDIQEVPKENDTGYNRVKMFPYESSPITSESLKRQKIHND